MPTEEGGLGMRLFMYVTGLFRLRVFHADPIAPGG